MLAGRVEQGRRGQKARARAGRARARERHLRLLSKVHSNELEEIFMKSYLTPSAFEPEATAGVIIGVCSGEIILIEGDRSIGFNGRVRVQLYFWIMCQGSVDKFARRIYRSLFDN